MTQLLMLFWSFFQVGLLSFGGGMASLPLIQEQVVDTHAWLTLSEFSDLVTIAEMTPGPLAVNAATFVGIRIAGIPGALLATFGCILPACVLVTLLAWVYKRYKQMTLVQVRWTAASGGGGAHRRGGPVDSGAERVGHSWHFPPIQGASTWCRWC